MEMHSKNLLDDHVGRYYTACILNEEGEWMPLLYFFPRGNENGESMRMCAMLFSPRAPGAEPSRPVPRAVRAAGRPFHSEKEAQP